MKKLLMMWGVSVLLMNGCAMHPKQPKLPSYQQSPVERINVTQPEG